MTAAAVLALNQARPRMRETEPLEGQQRSHEEILVF